MPHVTRVIGGSCVNSNLVRYTGTHAICLHTSMEDAQYKRAHAVETPELAWARPER